MYSYEIEQVLKLRNYNIYSDIYLDICNSSPQITHIKYDSYNEDFHIWTNDNYYWNIKVYRKEDKL